jgi:putative ABC transport system permease protein
MNIFSFAVKSALGSRRTAAPLLLLGALTTAVITGAVLSGDFVRETLSEIAKERLGKVQFVLDARSRFISTHLLDGIALSIPDADMAACILTTGSASSGDLRISAVQVVGVDADFFRLSPEGSGEGAPHPTAAIVNERMAAALTLEAGSGLLLSVAKADAMPLDAPLSGVDPGAAILSLNVQAVADSGKWGRFSLRSEQRSPATIFVDRDRLARAIGRPGKTNLVLAAARQGSGAILSKEILNRALADVWDIRKAGFAISTHGRYSVLESERVFIEQAAVSAMEASVAGGQAVSAYFLDSVRTQGGSRRSPFVFAAGLGPELLSGIRAYPLERTAASGGATITSWLSEDLGVGVGDSITLSFRVPAGDALEERTAVKRIDAVVSVPVSAPARALMPGFPGMAAAESCSDWDAGIPLDLSRVRPADEEYWNSYRGTPKIFLSLEEGRSLWANAYGDETAYFFPGADPDELAENLSVVLGPSVLGVSFTDAADYGLAAETGPLDFGALFLGLSLFLAAASLLLTGMVFSLHIAFKERETGLLLAVGFLRLKIAVIRLLEGGMMAVISAIGGCTLGVGYSLLIAAALNGAWSDAVAGGGIGVVVRLPSLALAGASGAAVSLLTMAAAALRRFSMSPASLLSGSLRREEAAVKRPVAEALAGFIRRLYGPRPAWIAAAAAAGLLAVCSAVFAVFPGIAGSGVMGFFISGAAGLAALLFAEGILLARFSRRPEAGGMLKLALRNAAFRRRRTLAASIVIACGLFVIASVGANPWLVKPEAEGKTSGSGGFAYFVRTSRPFRPDDIQSRIGPAYRLVSAKLREGDDASCMNLARSVTPPLVGVPASALAGRFSFASVKKHPAGSPWEMLDEAPPEGGAYAFADSLSLEWNLGLKVGDPITIPDEFGRPLRLEIAGALSPSVFQGSIVISENAFREHFPSISGKSIALISADSSSAGGDLAAAFRSYGAEIEGAGERLESFARVQYAYLSIFLFLGAAGLLFGMAGFAVMTIRNIREEASGRALLRAFGFLRWRLVLLSVGEQSIALFGGLVAGAAASVIALLPLARSGSFPVSTMAFLMAGAAVMGLAWTTAASLPVPEPERRTLVDLT